MALSCAWVVAQDDEFSVKVWDTEDGLPENSATAMVQDNDGFLWFGTFNGLVRFDGVEFKVYNRSNLPVLPSPGIVNLYIDQHERLWISTLEGLVVRSEKEWTAYSNEDGWDGDYIRTICEDQIGTIYITSFDGKVFQFKENTFTSLPAPRRAQQSGLFSHVDDEGTLWVLDDHFFGYFKNDSWHTTSFLTSPQPIHAMTSSINGDCWLVLGGMLKRFSKGAPVFQTPIEPNHGSIWNMYEDRHGNIWLCTFMHGLIQFRARDQKWIQYDHRIGFPRTAIRCIFEDYESNLWVGYSGGGLVQLKRKRFHSLGTQQGLNAPIVKSVAEGKDGTMLAATLGGGLTGFKNGQFTKIEIPTRNTASSQTILVDNTGTTWLGLLGDGLVTQNHFQNEWQVAPWQNRDSVYASFQDSSQTLWFGSDDRIIRIQGTQHDEFLFPSGLQGQAIALAQSPESNQILVGTSKSGLLVTKGERLDIFDLGLEFNEKSITSIHALTDEELLLGTIDSGILHWKHGHVTQIDESRQFPSVSVAYILPYQDQLWIGTNRGILRTEVEDLLTLSVDQGKHFVGQHFTTEDGLSTVECPIGVQPSAIIDSKNRLWSASHRGLNWIDPDTLELNKDPVPIVFEMVSYLNRNAPTEPTEIILSASGPPEIPPDHSNLEIRFSSPSFRAPEKLEFEIEVIADHTRTSRRQTERFLRFHHLPPGTHTIRARTKNSDGFINPEWQTLQFYVIPHFWERPAIQAGIVLIAFLLTGGGGFFISHHFNRFKQRHLETERRLGSLLNQTQQCAAIGGWELDLTTEQLFWTPQSFQIHPGMMGKDPTLPSWISQYLPDDRLRIEATLKELEEEGRAIDIEVRLQDSTKSKHRWIRITGRRIVGVDSRIYGSFQDIQDQKNREDEKLHLESQVRHAQKMDALGTLAGGIAHDFNNILTGIVGFIEQLEAQLRDNPESKECLKELRDATDQATDVVRRILSFSRNTPDQLKTLSLTDIVSQSLTLIRAATPTSIEIRSEFPAQALPVRGSSSQLHQVFVNLLTNASQALEGQGLVCVRLFEKEVSTSQHAPLGNLEPRSYAVVEITDNGPGIPKELLDRIFDPFFTTKTDTSGTGLGLSIVVGIVKSHEGAIRVITKPNEGTTFSVFLPTVEETEGMEQAPPPPPADTVKRSLTIMVIDDDPRIRKVNQLTLERLGHVPVCFSSGLDAIEAFKKTPEAFDLVLTDYSMPKIKGDGVIRAIKQITPVVPIIMVTGLADEFDQTKNSKTLPDIILQKPYSSEDLRQTIESLTTRPSR